MKIKNRFSIFELIVIIFIVLTLMGMTIPVIKLVFSSSNKGKTLNKARSLGLTLMAYAEDDVRKFRMPYPLPKGKEKAWGNSKECWSTSVAQMLLEQRYLRKGEEDYLKSEKFLISKKYIPMKLNDATINGEKYWHKNSELDFHIYCSPTLNSNITGKLVLIATYDNDDIRDCQFSGSGWVVFYTDKTTEFVNRAKLSEYHPEAKTPLISVNKIEGSISGRGILLRKDIPITSGGPGTFGLGGGSTELMGKRDTDAICRALIKL